MLHSYEELHSPLLRYGHYTVKHGNLCFHFSNPTALPSLLGTIKFIPKNCSPRLKIKLLITSISILANPFSIIGSYLQSENRKFRQTPYLLTNHKNFGVGWHFFFNCWIESVPNSDLCSPHNPTFSAHAILPNICRMTSFVTNPTFLRLLFIAVSSCFIQDPILYNSRSCFIAYNIRLWMSWHSIQPCFRFRSRITDKRRTSLPVDINLLEAAQAIAAALSLLRLWRKRTTLKSVPRKYPAQTQYISHLSLALSWKKKNFIIEEDGMRAW